MQLLFEAVIIYLLMALATASSYVVEKLAMKIIGNETLRSSLSTKCSKSLVRLNTYLNSSLNPPAAYHAFYSAYGRGRSNEFVTDSRFQYRMLLCFKVAGETEFSISEFPTTFCYRHDPEQYGSVVYTICIPTPCLEDQHRLWDIYEKVLDVEPWKSNGTLAKCIRSRSLKQWYQSALSIFSLSYIMLLWLIVGFSTAYHCQRGSKANSTKEHIFLAFSAKQNIQMLYKMPKNHQSTITCMFGIRFLTMVWIVIGHTFAFVPPYLDNVTEYYHSIADNFANQWIANFLLSVDVFLVLGGTVNAYGFFLKYGKLENKPTWTSWKFWSNFYTHRIIRLWPTYCYTLIGVYFLSSTYYRAMWPEIDPTVQCPSYWWQNLLLMASLFEHRCMGWAWYISTEFILYLISPAFLLTFARNQYQGYLLSFISIALSDAARAHVMIANNMPPTQLGWNTPPIYNANFMEHFVTMYIKPQYRAAPYIIGLCLGYQLAAIQIKKFGDVQRSMTFVACGWIFAIFCAFIATCGLYPILISLSWPLYYLIYGALHRTVFAIAVAWLIYACHTGYGGFVNTLLSFKLFLPLSVLCYSVYLSHMPVIFASYLQLPFPYLYVTKYRLLLGALFNLTVAYLLGFQASMLSEFPALNIEHIIRRHREEKQRIASDYEIKDFQDV